MLPDFPDKQHKKFRFEDTLSTNPLYMFHPYDDDDGGGGGDDDGGGGGGGGGDDDDDDERG